MMSSEEAFSVPSNIRGTLVQPHDPNSNANPNPNPNSNPVKRKRSLPGTPDPDAEVIALSPKSLMATNRFICEICNKGFQRDQNLQLHRRGHNLPWKLRQRTNQEVKKKVYVCPEKSCVHHDPSRALGDLTGVKKHFSRKHGEKKWKCDKCSKKYAVQSDWKAHSKICGTREYRCDCGTLFSRKDSFITHRAFCEALAEQSARMITSVPAVLSNFRNDHLINAQAPRIPQSLLGFHHEFGGSMPEPLLGNLPDADRGQKLKLPLWLDQASSQLHPLNIPSNSNVTMPELVQTMNMFGSSSQAPWVNYRYQEASSFTSDNNLSMPAMPQGVLKREQLEENKGELSHSVMSSLYSSSQNTQGGPSHMSATALLQKATQMESTRINIDDNALPIFNNNNNSNNAFGLLVSSQANIGGGFSLNESNSSSFVVEDWQSREPQILGKQLLHSSSNNEDQLGLTRDFLGVRQQELAKFNPMGSVMNLQSQFGGHH